MINLKLSQKGIALVCLPLFFQSVFLIVLINSLLHADAAIKREAASERVIFLASDILRRCFDCATSVAIYNFTRDPSFKEKCLRSTDIIREDYTEVSKIVSDSPEQVRRLEGCQTAALECEAALKRVLYKIDNRTEAVKVFTSSEDLSDERRLINVLMSRCTEFVDAERVLCTAFVEQERRVRNFVVITLATGICLNILIAAVASIYFFRSISSRLEKLTENTKLIPLGKLNTAAEIGGTDEIATLDRAFHQAVNELHKSEEMRQQLVAMVSHDLRSPLGSVDAALTLISEGALGPLPEAVQEVSKNASADVGRLIKLTNDLLDAERLASGGVTLRPRSVTARSLLEEAAHSMEFAAVGHGVAIEIKTAEFTVVGDPDRLNQVLCNLIGNAIKFSAKGSTVTLEAEQVDTHCEFRVTDSGIGIDPKDQQIIFERFMKLSEESSPGKGLGLAICKALVELHGGELGVHSTPGSGSTFWFRLPQAYLLSPGPRS